MPNRRDLILATCTDAGLDVGHYAREQDVELPEGAIQAALRVGEVTMRECLEAFASGLTEGLKLEAHRGERYDA